MIKFFNMQSFKGQTFREQTFLKNINEQKEVCLLHNNYIISKVLIFLLENQFPCSCPERKTKRTNKQTPYKACPESLAIINIMRMVCTNIAVTWQPRRVGWNAHV